MLYAGTLGSCGGEEKWRKTSAEFVNQTAVRKCLSAVAYNVLFIWSTPGFSTNKVEKYGMH